MRLIFTSLLLFASITALASKEACTEKLTRNHIESSRAFKINTDSILVLGDEKDYLAQGISIIRGMLDLEGCDGQSDISFGKTPLGRTMHSCRRLVGMRPDSVSCYIESDLGYFFVTKDVEVSAFVIFHRWD